MLFEQQFIDQNATKQAFLSSVLQSTEFDENSSTFDRALFDSVYINRNKTKTLLDKQLLSTSSLPKTGAHTALAADIYASAVSAELKARAQASSSQKRQLGRMREAVEEMQMMGEVSGAGGGGRNTRNSFDDVSYKKGCGISQQAQYSSGASDLEILLRQTEGMNAVMSANQFRLHKKEIAERMASLAFKMEKVYNNRYGREIRKWIDGER